MWRPSLLRSLWRSAHVQVCPSVCPQRVSLPRSASWRNWRLWVWTGTTSSSYLLIWASSKPCGPSVCLGTSYPSSPPDWEPWGTWTCWTCPATRSRTSPQRFQSCKPSRSTSTRTRYGWTWFLLWEELGTWRYLYPVILIHEHSEFQHLLTVEHLREVCDMIRGQLIAAVQWLGSPFSSRFPSWHPRCPSVPAWRSCVWRRTV